MTDHPNRRRSPAPVPPTPPGTPGTPPAATVGDAPLPTAADVERWRALLDEVAAGTHDDALVRLVANAMHADADSVVWNDARFVAWWAEEVRARTAAAARRVPDDEYLAAGRALQARVAARRLGVAWHPAPPPLYLAPVVAPPAQAVDAAAEAGATPWVDLGVAAGVGRELWDEPVERWLALPSGLQEAVASGRYLALRIAGDSMEPAMRTGDTVLVALGAPPKAGAAVVARHPDDGYVCKRVRRVRAATIELESLAPGRPIITLSRQDELVLGTVVAVWGGGGG